MTRGRDVSNLILSQLKTINGQSLTGPGNLVITGGDGIELGTSETTAHRGDHGDIAYQHSQSAHDYSPTNHNHSGVYSALGHTHSYEPANANIQSHISSSHAPSTAQKNSDITKAEIEAKLTGQISSHSHAGSTPPTILILGSQINTGANVTPVNLTGMSFAYVAGGIYKIEIIAIVRAAAATTGHGFGVNCTTAPVLVSMAGCTQLANAGTTTTWSSIANNAIIGVTSGLPTINTDVPSCGDGILIMNATTGGTCQFIFRSETTAITSCMPNSVVIIEKLN